MQSISDVTIERPDMRFEYSETFRHMSQRRLERCKNGTIPNRDTSAFLVLVSLFIILFAITNLVMDSKAPIPSPYNAQTTKAVLAMGIMIILTHIVTHSRHILPLLSAGHVIYMTTEIACVTSTNARCEPYVYISTIVTTSLLFMILAVFVLKALVYSWVTRRSMRVVKNLDFWWSVRLTPDGFRYRPSFLSILAPYPLWLLPSFHPECSFGYSGGLDGDGRPHGVGTWHDTAYHGEILSGEWEHGIPVGPFHTIDYTSGYACRAVKVAFAHNRLESLMQHWFTCQFRKGPLQWGTCSVECSTAGKFFAHLPAVDNVRFVEESDARVDVSSLVTRLHRHTAKSECLVSIDSRGGLCLDGDSLGIPAMRVDLENDCNLSFCDIEGQRIHHQQQDEVVIFLHGFNSPLSDALKRIAQLWTLGDFPVHMLPVVFGWPASRSVCYFRAKAKLSETRLIDDFVEFVQTFQLSGYKKVHILAHSMGAKILFNSIEQLRDTFHRFEEPITTKMRLDSLVLLNPDSSLDEFLLREFDMIHSLCERITLYADHSDGALAYSEFFNRWKCLGKHPFALVTNETTPGSSRLASDRPPHASSSTPLDMDVIDVSWMEHNMHAMRHNFFDLNRLMIDDIREILTNKKRASQRTRLTHRGTNVWSFITPPKHMTHR